MKATLAKRHAELRRVFSCFLKVRTGPSYSAMFSRGITALSLILLVGGCRTLVQKPEALPFHSLYEPINDTEARRFLKEGIAYLETHYPPLDYPVREVELLLSKKNNDGKRYRIAEGFSKTEIINASQGIFAIYIAVPPSDPEFYPLLAHEIGHLKSPDLVDDWAMEGFCMLFSEMLCQHLGYDWSVWHKRYHAESKDPYAQAYHRAKARQAINTMRHDGKVSNPGMKPLDR